MKIDPFTRSGPDYPVGCFCKSKPPLPSQVPLWGEVIHHDGTTFSVLWDFCDEITEHNCEEERMACEQASQEVLEVLRGLPT